jgi:hypothetical protein
MKIGNDDVTAFSELPRDCGSLKIREKGKRVNNNETSKHDKSVPHAGAPSREPRHLHSPLKSTHNASLPNMVEAFRVIYFYATLDLSNVTRA